MISFKHTGDFKKTGRFFHEVTRFRYKQILDRYGKEGVRALSAATPIDTSRTADAWDYKIKIERDSFSIAWTNSNIIDGVPIAVILQYGHGTRNGGYVPGRDYINPALQPIFDQLANEAWKEITSL